MVRSRKIAAAVVAGATADQVVFTCPANRTAIVKSSRVRHFGAGTFVVYALQTSDNASTVVASGAGAVGTETRVSEEGQFVVLEEGDELHVLRGDTTTTTVVWVSGALLDGDPV